MGPTSKGEEEGMVGRGGEGAVEEREGGRKAGREGEGRGGKGKGFAGPM